MLDNRNHLIGALGAELQQLSGLSADGTVHEVDAIGQPVQLDVPPADLFNVLQYAGDPPLLADQPLLAKVLSTAVATVASWVGNRYWTFRHTRRPHPWRELALFVCMCTIGLGLSLLCLAISHYLLGLQSAVADNIAANVVGLAVGTAFRFWAYKRFVFTHVAEAPAPVPVGAAPQ